MLYMTTTFVRSCLCHTSCVYIITQDAESALMRAADWGHTEVVVELVKAGANKDLQDEVCH